MGRDVVLVLVYVKAQLQVRETCRWSQRDGWVVPSEPSFEEAALVGHT
jgi:hypothetical protein